MDQPFYRPVKPLVINQRFGENTACVSTDGKNTVITCNGLKPPPGFQSLYGPAGHLGLDLRAIHSQPVYCALDGVVDYIDTKERSGLDVRVVSEWRGRKLKHIYEHLLGYQPKKGDKVSSGDLIGWADNTGYSSNDHLHFQVEEFLEGKWVPIDPLPLLSEFYAQDRRTLWELVGRFGDLLADYSRAIGRR